MMVNSETALWYRHFRQHQRDVYANGGGTAIHYPTGRVDYEYGSAPYGEHALSAYILARSQVTFRKHLKRST